MTDWSMRVEELTDELERRGYEYDSSLDTQVIIHLLVELLTRIDSLEGHLTRVESSQSLWDPR